MNEKAIDVIVLIVILFAMIGIPSVLVALATGSALLKAVGVTCLVVDLLASLTLMGMAAYDIIKGLL